VSILAQAQKMSGSHAIDRYISSLGVVAQMKPGVLDKFDADNWADVYADQMGVDPDIIVPERKVALIRQQRAQAQQQQEQMDKLQQMAGAAKDLASADTSGENALTDAAQVMANR